MSTAAPDNHAVPLNRQWRRSTTGYNDLIQIIPALIVAPMFIRGAVEFGVTIGERNGGRARYDAELELSLDGSWTWTPAREEPPRP